MSRLWIDANVIMRFLTKDPPDLAERSARLMAKAERGEVSLYISPPVLAEVIWVLKSFDWYSMTAITYVIISIVSAPGVEVDNRALIIRAVELARDRNVDFADAYWRCRQPSAVRRSAPSTRAISSVYRSTRRYPAEALPRFPGSATPPPSISGRGAQARPFDPYYFF